MTKNGLVIADSGVIFSLAVLDKLEILKQLFDEIKIPIAVWNEITLDETVIFYDKIISFFSNKTHVITWANELQFVIAFKPIRFPKPYRFEYNNFYNSICNF